MDKLTAEAVRTLLFETCWHYKAASWPIPGSSHYITPKHYVCYAKRRLQDNWYDGIVVGEGSCAQGSRQYAVMVVPETDEVVIRADWYRCPPGVLFRVSITDQDFDLLIARTLDQWLSSTTN